MTAAPAAPADAQDLAGWMDDGEGSTDRQVLARLIGDRLDLAWIPRPAAGLRARLERSGLPLHDTTACLTWQSPGQAAAPPLDWQPDRGDWRPAPAPAVDDLLAGRTAQWNDAAGTGYLALAGRTWLRQAAGDGLPQVTGAPLDPAVAALAVAQASHLPAIAVPVTQAALQAALLAAGFQPAGLHAGLVLAPLLRASRDPARDHAFRVEVEDIARFGRESGDMNPLHFDDDFARALGFSGRIAHGMIFSSWLTRLLGTEYPGQGTIFLRNASVFFAPVYPGRDYTVRISSPLLDRQRGSYRLVAQVRDADGTLAVLAYSDVLRKPDPA